MTYINRSTDDKDNKILSIEFPEEGKERARKVVSRSRYRFTGKFPSWKMNRMMEWESRNELNCFRLLDANPEIKKFYEQPFVIHFIMDGIKHIHYPDILIKTNHSSEVWEIKDQYKADDDEVIKRTNLMESELPKFGYSYRILTDKELSMEPRLSNIMTILKFGRSQNSLFQEESFRKFCKKESSSKLKWGLLDLNGKKILSRKFINGDLTFNLSQPINNETEFCYPDNNIKQWEI